MSKSLYFYLPIDIKILNLLVEAHQKEFNIYLEEIFTDDELLQMESSIESLAEISVQPILPELTFEDFVSTDDQENQQKDFFNKCKATICIENLPYLETNPFQVSYLKILLQRFDEVLIDRGGMSELSFKSPFLESLMKLRSIDNFILSTPVLKEIKVSKADDPITALMKDIYKELERLEGQPLPVDQLSEKVRRILQFMEQEILEPDELLNKTQLNPKDFDDGLEKLKFFLKKIN